VIGRLVDFYRLQFRILWEWRAGPRGLIRRAITAFVVAFVSLWLTVLIVPSMNATNLRTIAAAVVIIAAVNLLVRPVILGFLASVSVIAVGAATLIFQILVFYVVAYFLPEFTVGGVVSVFIASLIFGLFNLVLGAILGVDGGDSYWATLVQQLAGRGGDVISTDRPGVVIVQIDGLAHPILAHQVRAGRVPFLASWVRSKTMRLDTWTALLPSQTSASQAGILHGNNTFIPAFRWWEKDRQYLMVSAHPQDAAEIVRRASNGEGLLSNDGASVGNLVSGDAARSYITMATIQDKNQGLGKSQTYFSFFASPNNYISTIVRFLAEVAKEYYQAARSHRRGIVPIMHRGMPYPVARAATNVALRDLSTALVMEEMYRGTPVIYVDYTDYDEIAHHSGPERSETLEALDGVDAVLATLHKATEHTPRPYEFIVLSDHGQSLGATFLQRYGKSLQDVVGELMGGAVTEAATGNVEQWGVLSAAASEASKAGGATGALTRAALAGRTKDGVIDLAPDAESPTGGPTDAGAAGDGEAKGPPELVVCGSGNLGLIYFPRLSGRVTFEAMQARWPRLLEELAQHPGVGALMVRSEARGAVVLGPEGAHYLDDGVITGVDPVAQYGETAARSFKRLDGMEHCPDIVAISLLDPETDEVAAFEELIGSHGGLGGPQTHPFILHPAHWLIDEPIVGAEAVYAQIRRWLESAGIKLGPGTTDQPPTREHDTAA
jgi:uncharacterized membrane protein YvlD (DUF360 family)